MSYKSIIFPWGQGQGHNDLIFICETSSYPNTKTYKTWKLLKKIKLHDLVVKGQCHSDLIHICNMPPCPNTYMHTKY
jgi:hypothetical protein